MQELLAQRDRMFAKHPNTNSSRCILAAGGESGFVEQHAEVSQRYDRNRGARRELGASRGGPARFS